MLRTKKELVSIAIDPTNSQYFDKILWCLHGYDSHPSINCVKIEVSSNGSEPIVWGYSEWRNEPGFRTLGQSLSNFKGLKKLFLFFENKEDALEYLSIILEPKPCL